VLEFSIRELFPVDTLNDISFSGFQLKNPEDIFPVLPYYYIVPEFTAQR
jgi:hypothetical protein